MACATRLRNFFKNESQNVFVRPGFSDVYVSPNYAQRRAGHNHYSRM